MGVQFNIKDAKVHAMAAEVAERLGLSKTEAVREALQFRLRELTRVERKARIEAMVSTLRDHWSDEERATDYRDEIYDNLGLPK